MSVARRRMIIWGVIGVAVVLGIIIAMVPRPVPVDLETVERGPMMVTLDHEGKSRVRDRFVISAPVAGRVQRIELEPGDPVVANETVLAVFQPGAPALLDSRTRAEAEANVSAAAAAVRTAQAQRARVQAETDFAEAEVRRLSSLAERRIIADRMLEEAEAQAAASREALEAAIAAERAAEHQLEAARARLLEPGDVDGASGSSPPPSIHLRSPVDGVVLRRLRESEAVVPMGEPLLEVANPEDLEVVADFLSTDVVQMRPGMPVLIDQWGGDKVLRGRVRRIEPAGFMKISALGVEEQRVNIVVDFDDAREAWESLGDEYRVEVRVVIWQSDDVLKVPTSSLFRHGDGWAVFAVNGGRAELREVEIGHRTNLYGEAVDGLAAGDMVIAHPPESVADGVRVEQR